MIHGYEKWIPIGATLNVTSMFLGSTNYYLGVQFLGVYVQGDNFWEMRLYLSNFSMLNV
jgi:hypothetical protein